MSEPPRAPATEAPASAAPSSEPAAGLPALVGSARQLADKPGAVRGLRALLRLNQQGGFDCPGCAWPEPRLRSRAEFCENGVKHLAHEATRRRVDRRFFAAHTLQDLSEHSDRWLEAQGRLVEPMILRAGASHYEPLCWDAAFAHIAERLRSLASPDEAVFYTSGRASNEAAFLYQLFARSFGTNNLPDCSNMCHESSGVGLGVAIGVGKGTVSLEDFEYADAIFVLGQNPGTNHPRMLTALLGAVRRGCRVVSINPLRERGLVRFANPKEPLGLLGRGCALASLFVQVRIGGDVALLRGISKQLLQAESRAPGRVLDWDFIREKTAGFDEYRQQLEAQDWDEIVRQSGVSRQQIRRAAEVFLKADRVIACWAMGLTQHAHGVANVREVVNLLLLRGQIGRPGAGVCPVRGHSNVQGDRTMGIWERPPPQFLDALEREFGIDAPRRPGLDTLAAIQAMGQGRARVFFALGGNFAAATPDPVTTHAALRGCALTVQVSTTLNRSHLVVGREALILPCLSRSERDVQRAGPQRVSVENSMSVVHDSQGRLEPASPALQSEPAIVARLATAVLGEDHPVPWRFLVENYDHIRERIARVVPGFEDFNRRLCQPGGFTLESGARRRQFATASGRAHFSAQPLPTLELAPGELLMMTLRSHDQFNTTVYSDDDRYRGIRGDRRVVLMNPRDMRQRGLRTGQCVELRSRFRGRVRALEGFRVVPYDIPLGCAGTYFPEANGLVPVDHYAVGSRTPAYKSVPITVASPLSGARGRKTRKREP